MTQRATVLLCLSMGCSRSQPPAARVTVDAATTSADSSAQSARVFDLEETDYRGAFNGAKVVATLEAKLRTVSGSCFYESVGTDIALSGAMDDAGVITFHELDGSRAVSTVTLERLADGTLSGTWSNGDASGPATLEPVRRAERGPVLVVTRLRKDRGIALCGKTEEKRKPPCWRDASVPMVLGLSNRPFERSINFALNMQSMMRLPENPEGIGATVTYSVVMNTRGILSIVSRGVFACSATRKDCDLDSYLPYHNRGRSIGLTAAVDAATIASSPGDFLDVGKARPTIQPILAFGFAMCVWGGDMPGPDLKGAVLGEKGVDIEYDLCANHVHSDAWRTVPYAELASALKSDSPFAPAWESAGD
jgi:hypothetical protein